MFGFKEIEVGFWRINVLDSVLEIINCYFCSEKKEIIIFKIVFLDFKEKLKSLKIVFCGFCYFDRIK